MNEIINLGTSTIDDNIVQTVNARDLHAGLEVGKDFSNWVKAQIKRGGLEEGVDYLTFDASCSSKSEQQMASNADSPKRASTFGGDQRTIEYNLTVDAAKHIALMSNTPKGKEVRKYFIAVEKAFRQEQQLKLETRVRLQIEHQYANSVEYKLGELVKEVINPNAVSRLDLALPGVGEPPKKPKMTKELQKFLQTPCRPLTEVEFGIIFNALSRT